VTDWIGYTARALRGVLLLSFLAAQLFAQATVGSVRGQITDPSGAFIPGATVAAINAQGQPRVVKTNGQGQYVINGLAPGTYTVAVGAKGFTRSETAGVEVAAASKTIDVQLTVSVDKQEVTVEDTSTGQVSTDPSSNAGALVLKGTDLDALADNPDDLQDDLQALAGPAAGPNGGQIFIDGFTGGRLPPKESIREIRINQNPFSSEYDKLGYGRIEILTKPGTDKFRGQMFFNFADSVFNSRNPFAPDKPPYQQKYFGGNLSGPIGKKASFFVDVERRNQDEVAVVNAVIQDPAIDPNRFSQSVPAPVRRTTVSPRLDYQLSPNNTLVGRYTYAKVDQDNQGVGTFSLASRGFNVGNTQQTVQVTETSVLNPKTINETRFQYIRVRLDQVGDNSTPGVQVLDSFTGGGASIGLAYNNQDRYEMQNYTTITHNTHLFKFGGKIRGSKEADYTTTNYNGLFTFSTIQAYDLAQQQVAAHPGTGVSGATQFSLTKGQSLADVGQVDVGFFVQDDWRLKPNFTLSLGLRYETQNNIHDYSDIAPRVGFAWAVGGTSGRARTPKMVIRGGFGIFYDRFTEDLTLNALHLNGIAQQQYLVPFPTFYPNIPSAADLAKYQTSQTIRQVDSHLRAPSITQAAIGVERQLPKNTTVAVTFTNSRGLHVLRSRNINAPMPVTGVQPYGDVGNIYQYESSGIFNQHQLMTNVNSRVSSKFSLFGFYVLNYAKSNADGVASFPANQYDESGEYGRAQFDVRNRTFVGGSMTLPWGLRMSPFIGASSGVPFNITIGRDLNGDSLFLDRPAFATDLTRPSVVHTAYGIFDIDPIAGQTIIPRNYGNGPMQFSVNMRLAKTFGFGATKEQQAAAAGGGPGPGGPPLGGGGGGMRGGGGGGGGMRGGGGGGGGMGGIFGDATTPKRYNLTFSVSARNLLNRENLAAPIGTLTSPLFGQSNSIASGFFGSATANRRLELQMRFAF